LAMSSDNASSAVTYTSISSDSNGPSWGIPLVNTGELLEMDPYEEVKDQPYSNDASPTAESPRYIANSDSIEEDTDEDSIDYPDKPEDGKKDDDEDDDEDPEEDPSEEHKPEDDDEDPEEDLSEEHEPEDEDTKEEEPSEGFDKTEPFKEDETATTMAASTQPLIDAFAAGSPLFPLPPTSPAYDHATLGHREAMIRMRDDILEEDMPPRRRFVLTAPLSGCDVVESSAVADARAPRAADRAEDVGYLLDAQTDRKDIRLEIDVVRGQRTAYETELHEVRQDYLSFEAWNRELLARLKTLETHISRMEWQRQSAEDLAVKQMMRTQVLEARAQIDTVEDAGRANDAMNPESIQAMIDRAIQRNSTHTQDDASQSLGGGLKRPVQPARVCSYTEGVVLHWWNGHVRTLGHDAAYAMTWGTLKKKLTDKYCPKGEIKKLEIELWNLRVRGNDVAAYTQRFQELALMCTKFLADETEKVDKYISGLPDNIHGNVMSARPKTLDDAIELANDLMDQKLRTYAERQNDNKRKADDSSRNNQQPHKKQNVARAYTAGPGEKKAYTGNLPLCTKCNYHHTGQCAPKCGNCKRYGHATNDCRVNTNNNNNNNKNQKAGACYECGNTGHIKKNCPKLKNRGNGNGNGTAQGRAYALGGRDASPDSNVITVP
ncbi:putative reverse transcriptase domain-containing protein, partial [Tanacetum coccineum]